MKIESNFSEDTPDGVAMYINDSLLALGDDNEDDVLFNGYNCIHNPEFKEKYATAKRRVLFANWTPCEYLELSTRKGEDKILEEYSWFNTAF